MVWTKEKPTSPGFYYYRPVNAAPRHVWVAQVTEVRDKSKGLFCSTARFQFGPDEVHKPIDRFKGAWFGPLPDPGPYRNRGDFKMVTSEQWQDAIRNAPDALPMEPEIWAAGADLEAARFVARMLRQQGYYLVRPDDIGWPEIHAFNAEIAKGQSAYEDGGGFFVRAIMAMFGKKPEPVVTHRKAAQTLLDAIEN